jgi:hypothetical protein
MRYRGVEDLLYENPGTASAPRCLYMQASTTSYAILSYQIQPYAQELEQRSANDQGGRPASKIALRSEEDQRLVIIMASKPDSKTAGPILSITSRPVLRPVRVGDFYSRNFWKGWLLCCEVDMR